MSVNSVDSDVPTGGIEKRFPPTFVTGNSAPPVRLPNLPGGVSSRINNRRVAVKFLPPEAVADERAKKRLIREAQAAARLDHPNICAIYEVAEEDKRSFIVMQ